MREGSTRSPDAQERVTSLARSEAAPLTEWGGAAERGLAARKEREKIIASVLKDGPDFGRIPGTPKPTLLKPGAEKIADSLNLYPDYEEIQRLEDFDKPLFFYRYRCVLRHRGTGAVVATGIGSCNSLEDRYRWRSAHRKCPACAKDAIIKGKEEYGGGWLCYAKKGGCGAKWKAGDPAIEGQATGKVPNDDVFTLVNTVDKMAQKRALVAAALNLGFSEQFTQDVEDIGDAHDEPDEPGAADGPQRINEQQRRRLLAISNAMAKRMEIGDDARDSIVKAVLKKQGFSSSKDITTDKYETICKGIESYGEPPDGAA